MHYCNERAYETETHPSLASTIIAVHAILTELRDIALEGMQDTVSRGTDSAKSYVFIDQPVDAVMPGLSGSS
jgi:hypothetical protein